MKAKYFPYIILAFLILNCTSTTIEKVAVEEKPQKYTVVATDTVRVVKKSWIDSTFETMSLREKVAQLFVVWTASPYLPDDSENWQKIVRYAKEIKVGGFYFSSGNVYGFPINANALQSVAKIPLLISADFEWGAGMRIDDATIFPRNMALGATRDTNLAYQMAVAIAKETRALGVHHNYSPAVDINNNPKNPVINTRSFGEDPKLVSAMAKAFIRGTQEGNVIATVKHFPGHGDTDIDTHLDLPTLTLSRARFDSVELIPFKETIQFGVMSVMIAHIHSSAFDSLEKIPATASLNVTTNLLKKELNFNGLIVSDALAMRGMTKLFNAGEAAIRAVKAGIDVLLMSPNTEEAIDSILSAIQRKEISEERINYSVKKILAYKKWAGLDTFKFVDVENIRTVVAKKEHKELALQIARKSITVLGNETGILPLQNLNGKKILDVVFSETEDPKSNSDLHEMLKKRAKMDLFIIDPRSNKMEYDDLMEKAKKADLIICQFNFQTRSAAKSGTVTKKISDAVSSIISLKKDIVAVAIGNPYVFIELPKFQASAATYSLSNVSLQACAEVLFGEQPATGKLPITITGKYNFGDGVEYPAIALRYGKPEEVGFNADSLRRVDKIITKAIADSAFPGAVLLVARNGIIVHEKAYGKFTYDSYAPPMTTDAIFDMASVTKVLSTTSAVMKLVEEKKISLNDPIIKYFPAFGQNGKEKITIYNLLVHNSGLPAWRKFYEFCNSPQCVIDSIFATSLTFKTGDSTVYSDLGLITTGKIIEKVTGVGLDVYVDSVFFKPLGMNSTMYNPPQELWEKVVPTEIDSFWKKTYTAVHGRVHDENAATLGGVSGHAGLFSTASDVARLLQMELNGGVYAGVRYLKKETIDRFTKQQSPKSSRGIGWDTRATGSSFSGNYASPKTFLHTGFTGTSVVVDPEKNVIVVFLTNRVYPTRNNLKILHVRPQVHDAIFSAIKK